MRKPKMKLWKKLALAAGIIVIILAAVFGFYAYENQRKANALVVVPTFTSETTQDRAKAQGPFPFLLHSPSIMLTRI